MGWFSKKKEDAAPADAAKPAGEQQREFQRYEGQGERVILVGDRACPKEGYELRDVSLGGLAINKYDGALRGGQYLEFRLTVEKDGKSKTAEGFANVVRVTDTFLACKFPPQPKLKKFLREYLNL